jgi:hypothetical protein
MSEHDKYKVNGTQQQVKRVSLQSQAPLLVEPREGYVRYVMNNKIGEREKFERAGWKAVIDQSANQSDSSLNKGKQIGTELVLTVNQDPFAKSHTATVMEIPEHLYKEDFKEAMKAVDKTEEALNPVKNRVNGSSYGIFEKEVK